MSNALEKQIIIASIIMKYSTKVKTMDKYFSMMVMILNLPYQGSYQYLLMTAIAKNMYDLFIQPKGHISLAMISSLWPHHLTITDATIMLS